MQIVLSIIFQCKSIETPRKQNQVCFCWLGFVKFYNTSVGLKFVTSMLLLILGLNLLSWWVYLYVIGLELMQGSS